METLFELPLRRVPQQAVPQGGDDVVLGPGVSDGATQAVAYTGGLIGNLATLLSAGADVATLWNRPVVDTEAMLQGLGTCPDMNWADRGIVLVRLIFNTLSEARSRAAILMCNTWNATQCTFVPILSHNMLKAVRCLVAIVSIRFKNETP